MRRPLRWLLIGYVVIALIAGWPILSIVIAGTIAEMNDCTLHEGFSNPCIVNGTDVGQTLYTMGMLGFFAIGTIPIGVVLFLLWTTGWLIWLVRTRRRAAMAIPPR